MCTKTFKYFLLISQKATEKCLQSTVLLSSATVLILNKTILISWISISVIFVSKDFLRFYQRINLINE